MSRYIDTLKKNSRSLLDCLTQSGTYSWKNVERHRQWSDYNLLIDSIKVGLELFI